VTITVDDVRTHLGIDPATTVDQAALQAAVDAANDVIVTVRPDMEPLAVWPPRVNEAAVLRAARLYGRRGSVQGVAAFADLGMSPLPRLDPDERFLLELGEYQKSVVA
jgi:hypothetical protein